MKFLNHLLNLKCFQAKNLIQMTSKTWILDQEPLLTIEKENQAECLMMNSYFKIYLSAKKQKLLT